MAHVVAIVEIRGDLRVGVQPPVVQHQNKVVVHIRRFGLVHDQRTVQTPRHLLNAVDVAMVPEGPRVRQIEAVVERAPRPHRCLRHARNAVHGVVDPDAVPVDGGGRGQSVLQPQRHLPALPRADGRPRRRPRPPVERIAPEPRLGIALGHDPAAGLLRQQTSGRRGHGGEGMAEGGHRGTPRKETPARDHAGSASAIRATARSA